MSHDQLFAFESDFVASLRCIPMERTMCEAGLPVWRG